MVKIVSLRERESPPFTYSLKKDGVYYAHEQEWINGNIISVYSENENAWVGLFYKNMFMSYNDWLALEREKQMKIIIDGAD